MLALGHRHKTENFFFLMQGTLTITSSDGMAKTVSAPFVFKSSAGTRKMVYTHTAVEMCEVHSNPDNCTDVEALENRILTKSRASVAFERRKAIA